MPPPSRRLTLRSSSSGDLTQTCRRIDPGLEPVLDHVAAMPRADAGVTAAEAEEALRIAQVTYQSVLVRLPREFQRPPA